MKASRIEYMSRFYGAVDSVCAGRRGSISDTRFFIDNYSPECYPVLESNLSNDNPDVRAETIRLLAHLGIAGPAERIAHMSMHDCDAVAMACAAYRKAVEPDLSAVGDYINALKFKEGREFIRAARMLEGLATEDSIPEIRRVYGRVQGDLREHVRDTLSRIVDRHPHLESRRDFILAPPVYPDQDSFRSYVGKATEYLDVRYREKVKPRSSISMKMHNDVVRAILNMQTRLYTESDNLEHYSEEAREESEYLEVLIAWASEDLSKKEVVVPEDGNGRVMGIREYR